MLAVLARTLCGGLLLLGLVSQAGSSAQNKPNSLRPNPSSAVRLADCGGSTASQSKGVCHKATIHRVYRVTAYCDRGLTAAGVPSGVGQCAAPIDIPFGAWVYIPALDRTFVVTDRTAKRFRHNTVDLFIPDHAACLKFGCRYLECQITLPDQVARYGSQRLRAAVAAARR